MKKYLLTLTLAFLTIFAAKAQVGTAIIFSEEGETFTVILNGLPQNQTPTTNVKLTNLNAEWYKMKVKFTDATIGTKDFNLAVSLGNERSMSLHRKKGGDYSLRMVSETPLAQAPPTQNGQTEVQYGSAAMQGGSTTTISTQTTTSSGGSNPNGAVNMGMNVNGMGVGISVSGVDMETSSSSSTTTTTTTTTSSSGNMDGGNNGYQTPPPSHYNMPGYNGPIGCPYPMNREEFNSAKASISSKSFEESKMTVAKQIIGSNCLTCSQVKEVMLLFSFEGTKLDFAKYAYGYTFDLGNYYKLNDAFTFSSSIDDLNKYIESHKR